MYIIDIDYKMGGIELICMVFLKLQFYKYRTLQPFDKHNIIFLNLWLL